MPTPPRDPDQLLASALSVIDKAFAGRRKRITSAIPLFSGGYDSLCGCYCASQHSSFEGEVHHINTGIGAKATRKYVDDVCTELRWNLKVYRSPATYESIIRDYGFPGPGAHQWAYIRLKERCVRMMVSHPGRRKFALITGCRSAESTRRMGHVEPVKFGEWETATVGGVETQKRVNLNRVWVAPCHDWTDEEQQLFMRHMDFPRNPIKDSLLGMSGECFCGAFARPNELEMIRQFAPDVYHEIQRLEAVAEEVGITEANRTWGYREGRKAVEVLPTGELCSTCDRKAMAAGIVIKKGESCQG